MFQALMRKMNPPDASSSVAALEAELGAVDAELTRLNTEHAEVALASAEGVTDASKALATLAKNISKAEARRNDLEVALRLAQERVQIVNDNEQERHRADQWKQTHTLALERDKLAGDIETAIADLHAKYEQLLTVSAKMYETAPAVDDKLAWSALSVRYLEEAFRKHLVKTGFTWAFSWPWGADNLPTLSDKVAEGNKAILSRRDVA